MYLCCAVILPYHVRLESDLGFPEQEHLDIERNKTRIPLYIPGKCQPNQLLYPGDQKTDWICDCKPGYLYYAPMDGCYEAFRQGPCAINEYLTLPSGEFNPKCTVNPCKTDGYALYNNTCHQLNKPGGPCNLQKGDGVFGVDSSTLSLGCIKGADRISMILPTNDCPPGSQRNRNGCKP